MLLLESRHAALSIEEKETAVIKQRPENTEILESMRLRSHLQRILEQADAIPNPADIPKVFKGWHEDSRQKIENYLATKEADVAARVDEELILGYCMAWRTIRVIVATFDLAIMRPVIYEASSFLIVDESGQSRQMETLMICSNMKIQGLFLV